MTDKLTGDIPWTSQKLCSILWAKALPNSSSNIPKIYNKRTNHRYNKYQVNTKDLYPRSLITADPTQGPHIKEKESLYKSSSFSTCIWSQARQTRMVNNVNFTPNSGISHSHLSRSIQKLCGEVLVAFGTKDLRRCSQPSQKTAGSAHTVLIDSDSFCFLCTLQHLNW